MKRIIQCIGIAALAIIISSCSKSLPTGVVKESYIHKYGVSLDKDDWKARGRDGKIISTMKNGVTITRPYKNGKLNGEVTYSFQHSQLISKTQIFNNDKLITQTKHYSSGVPMWEERLISDNISTITTWYEDGTPQSIEEYNDAKLHEGEYFTFNNEVESRVTQDEGTRVRRDAYGDLLSKDLIKDGKMVLRSTFHHNGDPKTITEFSENIPNGTKKTFWIGGVPNTLEEWVKGEQHGTTIVFQNGEKHAEVPYVKGNRHGIERRFNDEKIVAEEVQWKHGSRHGASRTFFDDKVSTTWFYNGRRVDRHTFEEQSSFMR